MNHAARALATLRRLGPMTANELMHATGVSATTLRRYLVPPRVIVVGERGKGREKAKVYGLSGVGRKAAKDCESEKVFCDCGRPAAYRWSIRQLTADDREWAQVLDLCVACAMLVAGDERGKLEKRERIGL